MKLSLPHKFILIMKKIALLLFFAIALVSCKSKSATNTKLDLKTEVALKGNWKISNVSFLGSDVIKVMSFDVADSKCFIGSTWKFVSNNNKGNFELNSVSCTPYSTPITWYINKDGNFVMKILDESKAKRVKSGYILKVANLTDSSFQLTQEIDVAGKMTNVVYQFEKLN
jgi:hypothetical protein